MVRCDPDKVRFSDPSPLAKGPPVVHTVDLSDERSVRQFITFWVKGPERGEPWRIAKGLCSQHERDVYHRDEPWLPGYVDAALLGVWSKHYHLDLDHPPRLEDLEPFLDSIPAAVLDEIREYLS